MRSLLLKALARQLGGPTGRVGSVVMSGLNKGNAFAIRGAVEALGLTGDETVAELVTACAAAGFTVERRQLGGGDVTKPAYNLLVATRY
ncbi:hypothetical protein [Nocardioides sp. Kera G14]|uniref:hypothetical protein n=1 Tax=Nocardioides sp. Kera G14 TaxID=2884264 RepID=UPI001D1051BF|nr:hypothetical protein [Nocardioides sp. Kera G14]UDY25003.1 hypothetical protein LH076_06835 [Nocardioides sp. Kera G14]